MAKTLANYDPLVQIPSGMTPAGADFPIVESHDILVGENDKRLDAKLDDIDSAIGNVGQTPIATQLSSKVNTSDIQTTVRDASSASDSKIPSEKAVRSAIDSKTINVDSTVTEGSTNAVSGGAVHTQLATKQDKLTFDTTPTASSSNPVTSGGVKTALDAKQDTLTFDTTPTASSSNPVTSGGVKAALDNKQNTLTYETTPIVGSVNPVTSTGIRNAIDAAAAGNLGEMQARYAEFVADADDILEHAKSLSNGMVACSNIAAETTVGDTRILLYTGTTNSTYTNGHWYYNSAASDATPVWTDGGAVGSAPTIDNTLTTAGAAADSKSVGDAIENIVTISDTQPGSNSGNKVWIKETTDEEVQIPTYEEHISKSNKADIATNNESDNGSGTITASKAYAIGDHFYINNTNTSSENYGVSTLYKATAAIASGDAIVVGTNCEASKVADEITSLSNDLDAVIENLYSYITPDINISNESGLTITYDNDNDRLVIYGTASGARRLLFLNGQKIIAISSTAFSKTFDKGFYKFDANVSKVLNHNISLTYTYTQFDNPVIPSSLKNGDNTIYQEFNAPVMLGIGIASGTNFGTSDDPTYIKMYGRKVTSIDSVARNHANDLDEAITNLRNYNSTDILTPIAGYSNTTVAGVTYTWNEDNTVCTAVGTATSTSATNLLDGRASLPTGFEPGKTYYVTCNSTDNNLFLQILCYTDNNSSSSSSTISVHSNSFITLPSDLTGIFIRVRTTTNSTVNATIRNIAFITLSDIISPILTKNFVEIKNEVALPDNSDINDLEGKNEAWLTSSGRTYYNLPPERSVGFLFTYSTPTSTLQLFYTFSYAEVYKRRKLKADSSWADWQLISGTETVINQNFNHYTSEATYNVSPAITTDVNNFLQPSGDNTDRKADIETLLSTGCCRLAPGTYYVSGIDMPEKSELIGSGRKTVIVLLGGDSTQGYAIHMNTGCTVKDLQIDGYSDTESEQDHKSAYNYVNRHGILWEGTYITDSKTKRRGIVSGCDILNFSGGGITCYNTGTPVNSCLMVSDTFIRACSVGINIPYYSEFNIFTSVHARACYYGCINNGGNNLFSVCNFSANIVGMLMDNSQGQSPNNSHGSVVGCIFDHSNSNDGVGIQIDGCKNGEIFDGCQIFYSDIVVNNSVGIQFNNFNAGKNVDITVTKGDSGGPVLFNNWVFTNTPFSITVDDNYDACRFTNCFDKSGNIVSK